MADWVPKTRLGQMVLNGEITTMSDWQPNCPSASPRSWTSSSPT